MLPRRLIQMAAFAGMLLLSVVTAVSRQAPPSSSIRGGRRSEITAATMAEKEDSLSLIHCRLLQLETSMLSGGTQDDNLDLDVMHSSYACQALDKIYKVEFSHASDAAKFKRPIWVALPPEWISENDSPHTFTIPSGMFPRRTYHRSLNGENSAREDFPDSLESSEQGEVAPEDFTRIGRKTLLVVRIVTRTEAPDVGVEEMEAAIFGTIPHPHASAAALEHSDENITASLDGPLSYQSVVEQYEAATLGNLMFEPLKGPGYENGVLEIDLSQYMGVNFVLAGQGIQAMAPALQLATADRLGVTELTNAVDHVIFCLPNDSLLAGTTAWTAFTYLYEPYSYYQRSRCTKLSIVVHELGHSLGFRHSGVPTNAYADETGPMGYSVNQYGAPVKGFNSHKNWIAGWMQHFSVHLRRLNNDDLSTKTTYVGRVAALPDAQHLALGKEVVLLRLGRTLFLQYNRAKGFHRQTGTPNTVTIVYAEHEEDSSTRVASLEVGEIYEYVGYPRYGENDRDEEPDDNLGLVVALCRLGVDDSRADPIDYAEVVVQWRDPDAPKAADLNLALCNIRNDRSAPVLNFGATIDKTPDIDNEIPEEIVIVQPVNDEKQTLLLILGICMAAIGMACLVASAYLVTRHCRMWERQEELQREHQRQQRDGLHKLRTSSHMPESFDTAQTSSFDTWADAPASPPNLDVPVVLDPSESSLGDHEEEEEEESDIVPVPAEIITPPPRREWWEDIVENLKKLIKDDSR